MFYALVWRHGPPRRLFVGCGRNVRRAAPAQFESPRVFLFFQTNSVDFHLHFDSILLLLLLLFALRQLLPRPPPYVFCLARALGTARRVDRRTRAPQCVPRAQSVHHLVDSGKGVRASGPLYTHTNKLNSQIERTTSCSEWQLLRFRSARWRCGCHRGRASVRDERKKKTRAVYNMDRTTSAMDLKVAEWKNQTGNNNSSGEEEGDGSDNGVYNWSFICVMVFVVAGIVGNVLVCLAVWLERPLQNVTNWFLVSLAFADLIVSTIVMPFGATAGFLGNALSHFFSFLFFLNSAHSDWRRTWSDYKSNWSLSCWPRPASAQYVHKVRVLTAFKGEAAGECAKWPRV